MYFSAIAASSNKSIKFVRKKRGLGPRYSLDPLFQPLDARIIKSMMLAKPIRTKFELYSILVFMCLFSGKLFGCGCTDLDYSEVPEITVEYKGNYAIIHCEAKYPEEPYLAQSVSDSLVNSCHFKAFKVFIKNKEKFGGKRIMEKPGGVEFDRERGVLKTYVKLKKYTDS